ncbi:MAG: class I SAM-dependent methyltransferase [Lentimicrobium sp.]|nr:class I SAM-dependent methyltransferase [Lentimicrobium sp.]
MKQHWNERYSASEYIYGTNPNAWLAEKLKMLYPGKILLPAEGEGRNAVFAASLGWDVIAFDQSEQGQRKALELAGNTRVKISYHLSDLTTFEARSDEFDLIALIFVHMPEEIRKKVHRRLLKFLKPGGYLLLEAFTKEQILNSSGGPKDEMLLYDKNIIEADFVNLELLESEEVTTLLDEGLLHQGKAHVVRFFARKPII